METRQRDDDDERQPTAMQLNDRPYWRHFGLVFRPNHDSHMDGCWMVDGMMSGSRVRGGAATDYRMVWTWQWSGSCPSHRAPVCIPHIHAKTAEPLSACAGTEHCSGATGAIRGRGRAEESGGACRKGTGEGSASLGGRMDACWDEK
jgi:hypothetical protein